MSILIKIGLCFFSGAALSMFGSMMGLPLWLTLILCFMFGYFVVGNL